MGFEIAYRATSAFGRTRIQLAMTLIITALADDVVVQVSDRRLTLPDGRLFSDDATKAICIACADARVSLAYTGLARIGDAPTDHWLVDLLTETRSAQKAFPDLLATVAAAATERFSQLRHLGARRGLSLVFAGFGPPGAMFAQVSNQEDGCGQCLPAISDTFETALWLRNEHPMRGLDLMISGAEAAISPELRNAVEYIRPRYLQKSSEERVSILVQILRRAAKDKRHGWPIGEDCMGVVTTRDGSFTATYHSDSEPALTYMPHYVSPSSSAKDIWISSDENARPKWAPPRK